LSLPEELDRSILINPNIGHPLFLNIDRKLKRASFRADILYVSEIEDVKKFKESIKDDLKLVPIIEYKWKLRAILKRRKELEEKKKRKKKKGFWARRKERKAKKKREKEGIISNKEERLDKIKPRVIRGDPIKPTIGKIESVSSVSINNPDYIDKEFTSPQSYLIKYNAFDNLFQYYKVSIEFDLNEEVLDFLKKRNFVMLDIINVNNRINYHSIVISKNNWENFKFVHATDLHLAERNDRIYGTIKKWTQSISKEELEKKFQKHLKRFQFISKLIPTKEKKTEKPLIKRLINPNNQFRKFIKIMNHKVYHNELDFVAITGDIIDYTLMSKITKLFKKKVDFKYENSNWQIFKNIIINYQSKQEEKYLALEKGEELLCPIFTTLGNHDFRIAAYDLNWGGMYKKIGLNAFEAIALNEAFSASPIDAITKSIGALKGYWSEVNPSLDFSMKLGKNIFIFLNSGPDSFTNLRDLAAGKPSVTGLSSRQITYLENIINSKLEKGDNVFLFLHGPPVNTGVKRSIFKRLEKKMGKKDILVMIDDFRESILEKLGKKKSKARIDGKFNVKYGTISTNWERLMEFCKNYSVLTLAGHTHQLKEFRLEDPMGLKTKVYDAPPFSLKKIENPAAIYHDIYSEMYTNSKDIETHGPFIVQTPAIGLGGYKNPNTAGAYREINVQNGKLESFKVKFLNR